jgi:hypothetical protein
VKTARHAEYLRHPECTRHAALVSASILLSILLLITSCKSTRAQQSEALRPVYVTNTKKIKLLSPENTTVSLDILQQFNCTFGETSFTMLSFTQIDKNEISLSLINDFGTDMGHLFYSGEHVSFKSAFLPSKLPGEYIVAEIQNAYYDEKVLQENYSKAGLKFDCETAGLRKIYDGKKLIEEIFISDDKVKIINYLRGYSFELINAE